MTPTPTDPREDKPVSQGQTDYGNATLRARIQEIGTERDKLAAEIAELKEQKRPFSDKLAGEVIDGQVKRIAELETKLSTVSTELEELEAKYDELHGIHVERLAELEAARKELRQLESDYDDVGDARDTALAAKDAAEKLLRDLHRVFKCVAISGSCGKAIDDAWAEYGWGENSLASRINAALTPAPTQEPPAGGVTISTSQTEQLSGTDRNMPGKPNEITALASGPIVIMGEPYDPTKFDSVPVHTSPADVPSEGRGEWMPIETLDKSKMQFLLIHDDGQQRALLWNPRGYWEHPHPVGQRYDGNPTEWMKLPPNPMLPTEGSGA